MKSPTDIAARLAKEWESADLRAARLFHAEAWPLIRSIGKPPAQTVVSHIATVRAHVEAWRKVKVGQVSWQVERYRGLSESVDLPKSWRLESPSEWVRATGDATVQLEFRRLERLVETVDTTFHRLLVRQRYLWRDRPDGDVARANELAMTLDQGCAEGRPLRAISLCGIDSKFFERHRNLMIALLDERFDGQVSEVGLETFLGALDEGDHWLLVVPLDEGLLPFAQQRVRARELVTSGLPGTHLLIVENERCVHVLPKLPGTIAVLGAGMNLTWLRADQWKLFRIGYWGDMDTWGLQMLAQARRLQPEVDALLMNASLFDQLAPAHAVSEAIAADACPPTGLRHDEVQFYEHLRGLERGRLEQEFLPTSLCAREIASWRNRSKLA